MISHASLAKRPRLSYRASPLSFSMDSFTAEEELARQRFLSQSRLKLSWEGIFAKYSKNFEGIADEIDQLTGEIVVDNGHVRGMPVNVTGGKKSPKTAKKPLLCGTMRPVVKRDVGEGASAPVEVGCEACKFQDELDDSICLSCSPQGSSLLATPSTAVAGTVANLTLNSVSASASRARSSSTMAESPLRNSRRASLVDELMMGTPAPQVEDIPSDAFILKKLGNHGPAVVGLLAKARAQTVMSSPLPVFSQDDTPSKNRTDYIQGGRTEVEMSPHRAKSPFFATPAVRTLTPQSKSLKSSKISADQAGIRTWSPTRVATWMLTEEALHDIDDLDLVNAIKEHHVSGDVIAGSAVDGITLGDLSGKLGILSFSKRMKLWSAILKLRALAPSLPRQSQRQITSPTLNSMSIDSATETKEANPWAPPPVQEDPFYSHIWGDEHPDGTPSKFPPRTAGPMFFKSETPVSDVVVSGGSGAKKGVKRKRESLARNTSGSVKVEAVAESHSAKKSAVRALAKSVSKSPKVETKASDVKTSRPKTPAAKTPRMRSPVVKTPRMRTTKTSTTKAPTTASRTPAIKTPATNTKTPITKAPTIGTRTTNTPIKVKTPVTKTSIVGTPASSKSAIKTPTTTRVTKATKTPTTKTPTPRTPAAIKEGLIPGWTTSLTSSKGIGRSFNSLSSNRDENDKLSTYTNSGPASMRSTKRVTSTRVTVKDESNDDNNDSYEDDSDDDDDSDGDYSDTVVVKKESDGVKKESGGVKKESDGVKKESDGNSGSGAGVDRKDHVCTGGFCLVCLSLDGEEDDLV